jgi:2-C-methyl-D-erythritol 2,4-cyclodiphosphate synthase
MQTFRVGHGYDIHRLQTGGRLVLCGVVVSEQMSAIAHSDGDVVYHAIVDAVLGAVGKGDIGELFPNSDAKWKDADSQVFVERAIEVAGQAGFRLVNVDVTLLLEKPKVKPFKPQMQDSLRGIFGQDVTVNIKAGTNEGCDAIGRGEAVAAHAVVLLTSDSSVK